MNDKMHQIRKRFPDESEAIDLLMAEDPAFCVLCADHDDCIRAYGYWDRSEELEAETRAKEYRILIKELESEIVEALRNYHLGRVV